MRTCSEPNCSYPVFGTDKNTGNGYCGKHQYKRTDLKRKQGAKRVFTTKRKPIKKKRKPTGEKQVFQALWEKREHKSFISGLNVKPIANTFAHVLSKKQFPKLRLNERNIVFLTAREHHLYDAGTEEERQNYADEMLRTYGIQVNWHKLYDLRDNLKHENHEIKK